MADVNPADCTACAVAYCSNVKGTDKDPGCCKKTFLPMTSVIEAEGVDSCCPGVVLAYFLGPFYTLCCWDTEKFNDVSKVEITVSSKTGYDKLRY